MDDATHLVPTIKTITAARALSHTRGKIGNHYLAILKRSESIRTTVSRYDALANADLTGNRTLDEIASKINLLGLALIEAGADQRLQAEPDETHNIIRLSLSLLPSAANKHGGPLNAYHVEPADLGDLSILGRIRFGGNTAFTSRIPAAHSIRSNIVLASGIIAATVASILGAMAVEPIVGSMITGTPRATAPIWVFIVESWFFVAVAGIAFHRLRRPGAPRLCSWFYKRRSSPFLITARLPADTATKYGLYRVSGICPICGAKLALEDDGIVFPQQLIGRCAANPEQHIVPFDPTQISWPMSDKCPSRT